MSRPMTTQVSEPGETPDAVLLDSYEFFRIIPGLSINVQPL